MGEVKSEFYVTLASTACLSLFPNNTQSHFITKLFPAISLPGEWEVGLVEAIIPSSFFNILHSNNRYTLTYEKEIYSYEDIIEYEIPLASTSETSGISINDINRSIQRITNTNAVRFILDGSNITIRLWLGSDFEVHIDVEKGRKLLYILHQQRENLIISETSTFKYRPTTTNLENQSFTIIDKRKTKDEKFYITLNQEIDVDGLETIFDVLNENIKFFANTDQVRFFNPSGTVQVFVYIAEGYEIHISFANAPSLLNALNLPFMDIVIDRNSAFTIRNAEKVLSTGEYFFLIRKGSNKKKLKIEKVTEELNLPIGYYSSAKELFEAFKVVQLNLMPDKRVKLKIPNKTEIRLNSELQQILGFKNNTFAEGEYESGYPLELDAGITEFFVYTDISEPHRVGDTSTSLLRIIPLENERKDRIVRVYSNPLYFPVKKNYLETIEIELRTNTASKIIFTGGKTFLVLSFRRR